MGHYYSSYNISEVQIWLPLQLPLMDHSTIRCVWYIGIIQLTNEVHTKPARGTGSSRGVKSEPHYYQFLWNFFKHTFVVALPSVSRTLLIRWILLKSRHLRNITMPYIKHMGGSFFPGLIKSQSSNVDKILATVGHLLDNSLLTSAIQFSWHKPP